uniref:Uncharacterized protein n=2 Tax=Anguilla anguilla TaxID=7936 RepID=A0A0E9PJE8_ANGAN
MKLLVTLAFACALFSGASLAYLNGMKCFTCKDNDCTHTEECRESDDRCYSASVINHGQEIRTGMYEPT